MALESATYISDLNSSNPTASDPVSQGDDHIRLLKSTIKATFPNVSGAVLPTHTELNYVDGVTSPIQTQINAISPSQTGNSGKVLTTNGTTASWTDQPTFAALTSTSSITSKSATTTAANPAAYALSCSDGNYQYKTFTAGAVSVTITNAPVLGKAFRLTFEMTNAGLATITWPSTVKWPGGTQPTWTSSGTDIVEFVTRDGGNYWYCVNYQRDIK